jgi:hypothetical protein
LRLRRAIGALVIAPCRRRSLLIALLLRLRLLSLILLAGLLIGCRRGLCRLLLCFARLVARRWGRRCIGRHRRC